MSAFFTGFVGTPQGGRDAVVRRAVRVAVGVGVKRGWRSVSERDEEDEDSESDIDDDDSNDDDLDGRPALPVFSRRRPARNGLVPEPSEQGRYAWEWRRETLFDGSLGEIGLAGSIFRVMGTPGTFEGAGEWEVSRVCFVDIVTIISDSSVFMGGHEGSCASQKGEREKPS